MQSLQTLFIFCPDFLYRPFCYSYNASYFLLYPVTIVITKQATVAHAKNL